jgi:hypothetical protein
MTTCDRSAPLAALLERVREQYRAMPGLRLTTPQATRLFEVAPSVGATTLRALVRENFLSRTEEGAFVLDHVNVGTVPSSDPRAQDRNLIV